MDNFLSEKDYDELQWQNGSTTDLKEVFKSRKISLLNLKINSDIQSEIRRSVGLANRQKKSKKTILIEIAG